MNTPNFRPARLHGLAWALIFSAAALADPGGAPDPTFGDNGRALLLETADGNAVLQLEDGRLLVAGSKVTGTGGNDFVVARVNADGSLDTTFGTNGYTTIDFNGNYDVAAGLALQSDGRIIVGGTVAVWDYDARIGLARLNADGSRDPTFVDGRADLPFLGAYEYMADLVVDPDDRIVAAATVAYGSYDMLFVRFDADGAVDTSFGSGTTAGTTIVNAHGQDEVHALALQPDGKVVACGDSYTDDFIYDGAANAVRLNADGSLDLGFGVNGVWSAGDNFSGALACTVLGDDSIVVAGFKGRVGATGVYLARLTPDGQLDTGRWNGGMATIAIGAIDDAQDVIELDDGYLAVTGITRSRNYQNVVQPGYLYVARIEPESGVPDPGFGDHGVALDFGGSSTPLYSAGNAIIQQEDGMLVAAGTTWFEGGFGEVPYMSLSRMAPGGVESSGFVGTWEREVPVGEGDAEVTITVRRMGGSTGIVSLDYETAEGIAKAATDYVAGSGTLTWGDGDSDPKTFTIAITDDSQYEEDERFRVLLYSDNVLVANDYVTVLILNDDPRPSTAPSGSPAAGRASNGGAFGIAMLLLLAMLYGRRALRSVGGPRRDPIQ